MHALALAVLLNLHFTLCCAGLEDGGIACHDYTIDKDPLCDWVTRCMISDDGISCWRAEPFAGFGLDDFRCCATNEEDNLILEGCVEVDPVLVWVPWCPDEELTDSVTCGSGWVFDLDSQSWSC
jgi:hypothetical protein